METETPTTEPLEVSLKAAAGNRKRGGRKPKLAAPARVDAADLPVDGDIGDELKVEGVPDGYSPVWLTQKDEGRFRRRRLISVKWGNKHGCRPAFSGGDEKDGEPIRVNELTLYLEADEDRAAREAKDPARRQHKANMESLAKVRKRGGTFTFTSSLVSVPEE